MLSRWKLLIFIGIAIIIASVLGGYFWNFSNKSMHTDAMNVDLNGSLILIGSFTLAFSGDFQSLASEFSRNVDAISQDDHWEQKFEKLLDDTAHRLDDKTILPIIKTKQSMYQGFDAMNEDKEVSAIIEETYRQTVFQEQVAIAKKIEQQFSTPAFFQRWDNLELKKNLLLTFAPETENQKFLELQKLIREILQRQAEIQENIEKNPESAIAKTYMKLKNHPKAQELRQKAEEALSNEE